MMTPETPYPGLRAFETREGYLFYGREQQTQQLLDRLANRRFLAVVGSSGSGKSSLVRAGLVPALQRGFLTAATSLWRIAIMRPGNAPLDQLATELAQPHVSQLNADEVREWLADSSHGLVKTIREMRLAEGESLLLVVDQFEELFRFRSESLSNDGGAEAALFVASLLQAARVVSPAIYVVLTMRSDFLGDCAEFTGLPEALNDSQYLVPRLTNEQLQSAIERPLRYANLGEGLGGGLGSVAIAPRLVQTLLQDIGGSSDQLPVLQHALNRTFLAWRQQNAGGPIDLTHYAGSTVATALDHHAEEIWRNLIPELQPWTERVFRALTTSEDGRAVRRPTVLKTLYEVTGAREETQRESVRAVIRIFRRVGNSFLVTPQPGAFDEETVVDISHESLIRKWERLKAWVVAESDAVDWYRSAADDYEYYRREQGRTWRDPELKKALEFRANGSWNEAWARRVGDTPFAEVGAFLDKGAAEQQAEVEAEQEDLRRERELLDARFKAERRAKLLGRTVAIVAIAAAALVFYWYQSAVTQRNEARRLGETVAAQAAALERSAQASQEIEAARLKTEELLRALQASTGAEREKLKQDLAATQEKSELLESQRARSAREAKEQASAAAKIRQNADYAKSDYNVALQKIEELQKEADTLRAANADFAKILLKAGKPDGKEIPGTRTFKKP